MDFCKYDLLSIGHIVEFNIKYLLGEDNFVKLRGNNVESVIDKFYHDKFNNDKAFQVVYLNERMKHYKEILNILKALNINSIIDLGCAYGLLVEMCNKAGINAYDFDLPIQHLMDFHNKLVFSVGKITYGSINNRQFSKDLNLKNVEALILLDTLRYLDKPETLKRFDVDYILIKENCYNLHLKWDRRRNKESAKHIIRDYTPSDCLSLFDNYYARQIYPSKYLFKINNPSTIALRVINAVFPTYTLVLQNR